MCWHACFLEQQGHANASTNMCSLQLGLCAVQEQVAANLQAYTEDIHKQPHMHSPLPSTSYSCLQWKGAGGSKTCVHRAMNNLKWCTCARTRACAWMCVRVCAYVLSTMWTSNTSNSCAGKEAHARIPFLWHSASHAACANKQWHTGGVQAHARFIQREGGPRC